MSRLAAMKTWLSILVLCLALFPANGSSEALPQSYTRKQTPDKDPYALLNKARNLYTNDTRQALDLIEEALLEALKQNNIPAQGESYQLLGDINAHLKQHDLAAANYQKALALYRKTANHQKILELLKLSGKAYEDAEDYPNALASYQAFLKEWPGDLKKSKARQAQKSEAPKPQSKSTDKEVLTEADVVRLAISEIYARQKKYDLSVQNLMEVSEDAEVTETPEKDLIVKDKLGDVYREQNEDDKAISYYGSNANTAKRLNIPEEEGRANSKIAEILTKNKREEEALKLRERSIEIYNLSRDSVNLAREYLEQGKLLNNLNRLQASEVSLQSALNLAKTTRDKRVERESYKEISTLQEKRGQLEKSLESYKQYVALQDEAFMEKEKELEAKLELNASLNKQQQRMELLEKNQEINTKTIEVLRANETIAEKSATNQQLIIYGLLVVVILLAIGGYLMYKNMQRKRVANQLLALKSLRAQMNPHFIFNALNSVNHYISQKDERAANKYLSDFSRLMRAVLEHSQEDFITLDKELEIIKLYLSLEHNRFSEKFDYDLHIDENLDGETHKIPPMLVQPYVENAIWHGLRYRENKGLLKVSYQQKANELQITIEDNGIGRARSQQLKTENQRKNNSTGMHNIEDRVRIINNMYGTYISVKVEDLKDDGGTLISICLPTINQTNSK
jgi:tetratricopeptide (TPR) repeat protein